jgi:chromosomal replication initiation ATPase DnaA
MMNSGGQTEHMLETNVEITEELVKSKWPELAKDYADKPRLFSMLTTTTLTMTGDSEEKTVTFRVVNESQKEWVESKLLHELEGNFRKIVGSSKVYLRVDVTPDEANIPKVYMPSEKAKELMADNAEVRNLVKDFGLDTK